MYVAVNELLAPHVWAAATFVVHVDNETVRHVLCSCTPRCPRLAYWPRALYFLE